MIAALFALAAAMVIVGCAAVVQGFPYVRLESGLAMVIAGSVAASSGVVVFGLGVVAAGLRRVERAAGRAPALHAPEASDARPRLPPAAPAFAPPVAAAPLAAPALAEPRMTEPVRVEPPMAGAALPPERARIEPSLGVPESAPETSPAETPPLKILPEVAPPDLRADARSDGRNAGNASAEAPRPAVAEAEPELPIPGLPPAPPAPEPAPEPEEAPEPARGGAPEADLFAAPGASAEALPALRPSLDAAPEPQAERKEAERTVVGRYASGGNTYVMFEDGSIEAETPRGRFTFASLDELKAFVDGGGESRGAA